MLYSLTGFRIDSYNYAKNIYIYNIKCDTKKISSEHMDTECREEKENFSFHLPG